MAIIATYVNTGFMYRMYWKNFVAFKDEEGRPYRLDKSAVYVGSGNVYHRMYRIPDVLFPVITPPPLQPQNGDVVLGVKHKAYPDWLQLQNGRWIISSVVGREVIFPLPEEEARSARKLLV